MKENNLEDAPNTEASKASKPKLRLLCNPAGLPIPLLPKTEKYDRAKESKNVRRELKEYFHKAKYRRAKSKRR